MYSTLQRHQNDTQRLTARYDYETIAFYTIKQFNDNNTRQTLKQQKVNDLNDARAILLRTEKNHFQN